MHGISLLAGAAALTWLVHLRAPVAFFGVYETGAAALGTPGFITLRTLLGLTPLASAERIAAPPWGAAVAEVWPAIVWIAYAVALGAGLLWLLAGRGARGLGLAMLCTTALYALGLRYVVGYPYGHMKGLSFVSFALLCMVAGGIERLGQLRFARPARMALAGTAAALLVVVAGASAWDSYSLVRGDTIVYGREDLALLDLPNAIPEGAPVLVVGDSNLRGPNAALLAHALREHPLLGRLTTGYVVYNRLAEGQIAPYAVFSPGADPTAWGYDPEPLWRSDAAILYAAPAERLAHLNGQLGGYTAEQPKALQGASALPLALLNHGAYRSLREPLELAVSAENISTQAPPSGEAAPRRLLLSLAVAEPSTVQIEAGDVSQTVELAAGLHEVPVEVSAPAAVRLSSDGDAVLRWAELYPPHAPDRPAPAPGAAIHATVTPNEEGAIVRLATTPAQQRLRVALEIYEDSQEPGHYGWTVLPWGPAELELDLAGRTLHINGAAVPMQWGERHPGSYFASLWVYQGNTLLDRLPLFSFEDSGSAISKVAPLDTNVLTVALPGPSTAIDAGFEDTAQLAGATVSALDAGRTGQVSLWWQTEGPTLPLLVTVQLVDAAGTKWAQWDGLLGGDASPSESWRPDEVIRQDVPLAVDAATPPGDYQMLIGVYRPDGTRVTWRKTGRPPATRYCCSRLYVEQEIRNVPVLQQVGLAFHAHGAALFGLGHCAGGDQVVVGDHLGTDKAALDVGVDLAGCLDRRCIAADRPGAHLVRAGGQERDQPEQSVRCFDRAVARRLVDAEVRQKQLGVLASSWAISASTLPASCNQRCFPVLVGDRGGDVLVELRLADVDDDQHRFGG